MPEVAVAVAATDVVLPAPRAGAFRALHAAPFRWYFAQQVASASGTFLQQTAVGWLVLASTGSSASLGMVLAAGGLPPLVLGPWGGAVADRFVDLRPLLLITQTVFALLAALLWVAVALGCANVALIIAITAAGGLVQVVDSRARQAFIGSLVTPATCPAR